jgi:hypothetical protein
MLQLLDHLTHGLQLLEVLPGYPIPPVSKGNRADAGKCDERRVDVIPQVKSLLPPPLHRSRHGHVEIRIDTMLELDMKNLPPPKLLVPHLGPVDMARKRSSSIGQNGCHKGSDVQDPQGVRLCSSRS